MNRPTPIWANEIPEGAFISYEPSYETGKYFDLFLEDEYVDDNIPVKNSMKYYYYDPTEHGYPKGQNYPLLIFLHGATNSMVGKTCVNYTGAEFFATKEYQEDFKGAYLLVPLANEYNNEQGKLEGYWSENYSKPLYSLITEFIEKHTEGVGKKFVLGNSAGAAMTFILGNDYTGYFDALVPIGTDNIPDDQKLEEYEQKGVYLLYAIGKRDEFNDFSGAVAPRLARLNRMKRCFVYTPEWVYNGDKGISSINFGVEMGQHCLVNAMHVNLKFDDGTLMEERLPRGLTGWIDEVNRNGSGRGREYAPHGDFIRTGHVQVSDSVALYYEEYGQGDKYILSAQVGFYHRGMQQKMAELGYHVYCITLRGFHPSSLIEEDYGDRWYDVFAQDVLTFADKMNINHFTYMGASHGAGVGWHLMLLQSGRVDAFIAVVAGPHSLKEGTMSYRQMLEQGIIKCVPPFDPTIDEDVARQTRRAYREDWISWSPEAFDAERKLDYGRPMMRLGSEEKLCEALTSITVPTLLVGGYDDPISKPELLMRTAGCLPHCKLVMYSNCGHNIDTDLIEEVSDEADRFIKNACATGKWYLPVVD